MSTSDARRKHTEPMPALSRSLGNLLIGTAQLRQVHQDIEAEMRRGPVRQSGEWMQLAQHMLDLHDRIVDSIAHMHLTGSSSEHPMIRTADGIVIPVDAGYVTVLARRMERHTRIGRVLALGSSAELQTQVSA